MKRITTLTRPRGLRAHIGLYTESWEELMASSAISLDNKATKIWIGIVMGTALGVGIALSRRKRSRWDSAARLTRRVAAHTDDLTDVTRDIVDRVKNIYQETRKVVEEAESLWTRGRKLAGV